jgi:flagellar protein FliO/FliZ
MRKLFLIGAAILLVSTAMAADQVIYPHSVTTPGTPAPAPAGTSTPVLALAIVAAGVGGFLLWRQRRSPAGLSSREARQLAVLETRSLGNRQYLVVAGYEGRKFLLGVCPGRIDLLSPLEEGQPPETS